VRRFTYTALPGRVVFGAGAIHEMAAEVERLGARRILLIASERQPVPDGVPVFARFAEVRQHVPVEVAARARAAAEGADALLSIGGGSAVGTAKAVALETGLPIVAVPTTYSGSEMTPVWGLTEGARKTTGTDLRVLPKLVIYDPELTAGLPAEVAGPSAMNALAHAVEALYAPGASPITSLLALEAIRALAAVADGDGREQVLYGAYLAGAAFAVAGSGLHHRICHVLGGAYALPHAPLHTVMLPQVAAFQTPALPDEMGRVARALDAEAAGPALFDLARRIGAPTALRDIGMREADLDEAGRLVLEKVPEDNPRPVEEKDVRDLLEAAFAGRRP
jgi:alcohol dehydrogenase class IV